MFRHEILPLAKDHFRAGYERRIKKTFQKREATSKFCAAKEPPSIKQPLSCLHQTTPNLTLAYPTDAEQHFNEIHIAMSQWAQHPAHKIHCVRGYAGPWIENYWARHFLELYHSLPLDRCLSDIFGPYIPILIPFVDIWFPKRGYPEEFISTLQKVLRPNVLYITVSQNDDGLPAKNPIMAMENFPNLLVLSAGGYGHVPIPLLKQSEALNNQKDIAERSYFLSYVGKLTNAPHDMRKKMDKELNALAKARQFTYQHFHGEAWREIMTDSKFSLVPRGYGRTAYHLVETLQMGLIPIHVYSDVPWVPYADLFDKLGFVAHYKQLESLVDDKLLKLSNEEVKRREELIVSLRDSHFSFEGILRQMEKFLLNEPNDLRCMALPPSVTGK